MRMRINRMLRKVSIFTYRSSPFQVICDHHTPEDMVKYFIPVFKRPYSGNKKLILLVVAIQSTDEPGISTRPRKRHNQYIIHPTYIADSALHSLGSCRIIQCRQGVEVPSSNGSSGILQIIIIELSIPSNLNIHIHDVCHNDDLIALFVQHDILEGRPVCHLRS